ncbi:MAG: ABA4-like family protein [Pseudomonadota bacterium]
MELEQIFSLCGAMAMVGWAGLILAPRWSITRDWLAPVIVPCAIGVVYVWLMAANISERPPEGGFGSLAGVAALFTVPQLLLAGWVHYLAFDLFVGAWEVRDAQRHQVNHLLVIPCLLATFMAGPAGLVLYWVIKLITQAVRQKQDTVQEA